MAMDRESPTLLRRLSPRALSGSSDPVLPVCLPSRSGASRSPWNWKVAGVVAVVCVTTLLYARAPPQVVLDAAAGEATIAAETPPLSLEPAQRPAPQSRQPASRQPASRQLQAQPPREQPRQPSQPAAEAPASPAARAAAKQPSSAPATLAQAATGSFASARAPGTRAPAGREPPAQQPQPARGAPSGDAAGCVDQHPSCKHWADAGECVKNPVFMRANCRLSCKRCVEGAPTDEAQAEAVAARAAFDSAALAQKVAAPRPAPAPAAPDTSPGSAPGQHKEGCVDEHPRCKEWAGIGECEKNRPFMRSACRHSCNACSDESVHDEA